MTGPDERLLEDLKVLVLQYNEVQMILREISSKDTLEGILRTLVDSLHRGLDYQRIGLWFLDKDRKRLEALYGYGYPLEEFSKLEVELTELQDPAVTALKELGALVVEPSDTPFFKAYRRLGPLPERVVIAPLCSIGRKACYELVRCRQRGCPLYGRNGRDARFKDLPSFSWVFCEHFPAFGIVSADTPPPGGEVTDDFYPLKMVCNYAGILLEKIVLFQKIKELSTKDPLTGVYNRNYFFEQLGRERRRSKRTGRDFAVAMFDINKFKEINDRYGHLAGDKVLRAVSSTISKEIRGSDVLCRYGGDEFTVLMPDTDIDGAGAACKRIKEAVSKLRFTFDDEEVRVCLSGGVASYPQDAQTVRDLIHKADRRMYEDKTCLLPPESRR